MHGNIKILIGIGLFILLKVFEASAQTDTTTIYKINNANTGEIVMTKAELISFLDKIATAKKEKMQQDLDNSNIQQLGVGAYSRSTYSTSMGGGPIPLNPNLNNLSRSDLVREIEGLNARLNSMYGYGTGVAGNTTTILTTPGGGQGGFYPYQTQTPIISGLMPASANSDLRWKIDSLQRQVSLLSVPSTAIEKQDEIVRLNREIEQVQDSLIASAALTPEAKEIVKRYGSSEMQVFFDNDVSEVSSLYRSEVENAAIVLKKNPQLGVVLKGYASPVGNSKYNYDLSMRRNEAVKRLLIDYGVFPDQISSVFYGEDKTTSAKNARRVDIKFIIK